MAAGRSITVLIHEFATGGGYPGKDLPPTWLAEGLAMRRALLDDFAAVPGLLVLGTRDQRQTDEPGSAVRVMRVDPAHEMAMVWHLAQECDHTLIVAPESGGELLHRARALDQAGIASLGSTPEAIAMTTRKDELAAHLAARGIATPPSEVVTNLAAWTCPWSGPVVVKPVDGAGALDTFRVDEPGRWPVAALALSRCLVQPFVPGEPLSATFLVDVADQPHLLAVGRQKVELEDGQFRYRGGVLPVACDPADLAVVLRAVGAVSGLRGMVGVDFVRDPDRPPGQRVTVIEINPRPTTSLVGLVRLHPPGTIAAAWLEACRRPLAPSAWPDRLRQVDPSRRVFFNAEGTIDPGDGPRPAPSATPTPRPRTWVALDVGGANLKLAHDDGVTRTFPFELWKYPERLGEQLFDLLERVPPADAIAVTMTGELCDCFSTKAEGVARILAAVRYAWGNDLGCVWGTDARFHSFAQAIQTPGLVAAANWLALATVAAHLATEGTGLLIDVGSTTTDLIPLRGGAVLARGRTDRDRLQTGELVYAGARRTPVCALATEVALGGAMVGLAAELFATTQDVYLTLGALADDPGDSSTADGRPATADHARDRLARMVGADRDGFSPADARALATELDRILVDRLVRAAGSVGPEPARVIVAGSGEFLARRVGARVVAPGGEVVSLVDLWGRARSDAGCANALLELAHDWVEAGGAVEPIGAEP